MTPVFQTRFGKEGNCFQAAVASLLDLRLEDVPDFVYARWPEEKAGKGLEFEDGDVLVNPFWWQDFTAWAAARNLEVLCIFGRICKMVIPTGTFLAGGMSLRGTLHTVIYRGDTMLHDPHPDGTGLVSVEDYCWLVPKISA